MIKNTNINEESVNAVKEFQKKQINTNIFLHKIFLFFLICLDFALLSFIIIYKSKISEIKLRNDENANNLFQRKNSFKQEKNEIQKKLVNIFSYLFSYSYYFSFAFETSKEVNLMKNSIKNFYKEQNIELFPENFKLYFKYQAIRDGDSFEALKRKINYSFNTFIIIEAENKIKFGFFIQGAIIQETYYEYDDRENNCFLLFFKSEQIYKCRGDKTKLKIQDNKNGILIIGEDDIVIKEYFLNAGNYAKINFPFKSFENNLNNDIELNGEFKIRGIEIFSIILYNTE